MTAVIAILILAALSFLVIRIGATAIEHTGLSRDAARFQALSAYFGAGFTTGESELVVTHPVRRRVIRDLIVIGNIGVISMLTTAAITATNQTAAASPMTRVLLALGGLGALYILSRSAWLMRLIDWSIEQSLSRAGVVHALDYEKLLRTHAGYGIAEFAVEPGTPLAGRTLAESKPRAAGVTVLAIARAGGDYDVSPNGETAVWPGDTVLVYGADEALRAIQQSTGTGEPDPNPGASAEGSSGTIEQ